jgi:hypothetical protein
MTLLAERPATSSSPIETSTGSYVSLPVGSASARVEGTYVTVAGSLNLPPVTRGSYVTVAGAPAVPAGVIEGSYVTLPTAAQHSGFIGG